VFVDTFTDGLLGPDVPMLGPVADGGTSSSTARPGCWGPMITPSIRGGHEVNQPVAVEGARSATRSRSASATSRSPRWRPRRATTSRWRALQRRSVLRAGVRRLRRRVARDARRGHRPESIRCADCGADATPFTFTNGYTIAFDATHSVGVTVGQEEAERMARDAARVAQLPDNSVQNPILLFARTTSSASPRAAPFLGQLGHVAVDHDPRLPQRRRLRLVPDRRAAPLRALAGRAAAPQDRRPHGHRRGRAGAILVCPVKVDGGGIYLGDMHALQGDGEIAGHTCDVSGTVTLEVEVIKGLGSTARSCSRSEWTCRTSRGR
jgi:hypothetical protein